ncbi:MAG TPA: hypothetical protein DCS55_17020 [Acidimicrobiaceae bacterium]|nr:hypothetical protein [Acidimicrobiaceae bacterium]
MFQTAYLRGDGLVWLVRSLGQLVDRPLAVGIRQRQGQDLALDARSEDREQGRGLRWHGCSIAQISSDINEKVSDTGSDLDRRP